MDHDETDPEEVVDIGGWPMVAALYHVGGVRLVAVTLARYTRTTIKGWFGKG